MGFTVKIGISEQKKTMAVWIEAVGFMATSIEVCSSGGVCEKEFLPRAWGAEPGT